MDFYKTAAVASEELRDIRLAVEGYIEAFGRAPSLHYATFFRQLSGHNPKGQKYLDSAFFKKNRWGGGCVDGNGRKYLISKRGGTLVVASRSYAGLSVRISLPQAQAVRTPLTELEKACFVGIVEIDVSEGKSIALIEKLRERCKRDGGDYRMVVKTLLNPSRFGTNHFVLVVRWDGRLGGFRVYDIQDGTFEWQGWDRDSDQTRGQRISLDALRDYTKKNP